MQEKILPKQKIRTSNIHSSDFGSVSYDIFGSPYQKSGSFLANDSLDFGYLGKPYNADTELYDYGFRDYSPNIARFTTVDPIRDGRNWYSYVVNDPVNYVDLWGLCGSESDGEKFIRLNGDPDYYYSKVSSIVEFEYTKIIKLVYGGEVVVSEINTILIVVEKSEKKNSKNATIGTLSVYKDENGVFDLGSPFCNPEITVPIVTGGPNDPECPDGLWENIKKEPTTVSSNKLLRDGLMGDYYYRLPNTGGIAIHRTNAIKDYTNGYTEGCVGVTGDETSTAVDNYDKFLCIMGEENVTVYVK